MEAHTCAVNTGTGLPVLGLGDGNENKDKTQQITDKAIKPVTRTEMTTGHEMEFEKWMGKKKLGVTAEWEGLS